MLPAAGAGPLSQPEERRRARPRHVAASRRPRRLVRTDSRGLRAVAPSYPEAAVDWLLPDGATRVLDLGAGTGKLTASLVARGLDVVAVDSSAPMLAELRRACPGTEALEGRAEALPLLGASVDAVLVAQAWHCFDPVPAAAEIVRVLRPGGILGLVWNTRDKAVDWIACFESIVDCGDTPAYDGTPAVPPPFVADGTIALRWGLPFDEAALVDLATSRSAFLVLPGARRAEMLEGVRTFFDENASATQGDPARRFLAMSYVTVASASSRLEEPPCAFPARSQRAVEASRSRWPNPSIVAADRCDVES